MPNDNYEPTPDDYQAVEVAHISHVAYKPETRQAIIWFTSTMDQKIALVAPMADLNRAVLQLQTDPLQTRVRPVVIADKPDDDQSS